MPKLLISIPTRRLASRHQQKRPSDDFSLQEISDRLEIEELLVRYCYAVDDRDWKAYRNVFTLDAVLDDTATGGSRAVWKSMSIT
ncbi:nuclear transport factor 2 family protein [Rhizobium sullae]|uniref:nuclear transport factor 2 family protein n=1 Tax=Rhizobium sullae TaxID=50338 RepID=UPI001A9D3DFF